ncbi:TetR family transcriptional regulator [Mycobacterium paraffinicum]|uniref:TetR family transcriptional regulator n=1 Tax=Mycobacterium paraffinicum TaxID=53378 RepID=A0A1Q4I1Q7_9MYCO|nr:TetR/AcrR family transcriptional regulator [Mycobacterium paraffinicum]OJZ75899.1 TetR family transcriptional regulator [Mycobacterium paraffinicum]
MTASSDKLTGTQARTRHAIIEATATVLAGDRTATLPEIARVAGVGRTTLHRYFPDRESLIFETISDSIRVVSQAMVDAAPEEGSPIDALRRVVNALIAIGDRLLFLFEDPGVLRDVPPKLRPDTSKLATLIERGQAEGAFDNQLSSIWIEHALYSMIRWASEDANAGLMPRHAAAPAVIRILERGIRVDD